MTKAKRQIGVLLAVWVILSIFGGITFMQASAATVYSDVLTDLSKDKTFTVSAYSDDPEDYSVQLIQIAESDKGELYAYTYQPSQKTMPLTATSINISVTTGDELRYSNYRLRLLSESGVFCKYLVMGFGVLPTPTRDYDISSIYRKWDSAIDAPSGNDNTVNEVAYSVGKRYCAETVNGKVEYYTEDTEVITILNPYVGFFQVWDGLHWDFLNGGKYTDAHFIAFDTDKPIDTLQEADVSYITQPYTSKTVGSTVDWTYGDKSDTQQLQLTGEQKGGNIADGLFGIKYEWKRIQSASAFTETVTLDSAAQAEIAKTKWVLVFLETEYAEQQIDTFGGREIRRTGTKVSDVTILRLQFVTRGKLYNLGAVSDKVTGSNTSVGTVGEDNWLDLLCKWLEKVTGVPAMVWKVIICALPFIIALPILAAIFPVVGQILAFCVKGLGYGVLYLFKGLWWLICLPFRGIAALIGKIKEKKAA